VEQLQLETPHGPARAHLHPVPGAVATLVLGHGAGGGVGAPDLVAVTRAATAAGVGVVLVDQPYRVAGRRSPAPARQLDEAWAAVVAHLRRGDVQGVLVTGGRSSGARVACRTAEETRAAAVLCLAFPLHPPRRSAHAPPRTRQPEFDAVGVPVLVVQGDRDPFGMPAPSATREVVRVSADHALGTDLATVAAAVVGWLGAVVSATATRRRDPPRTGPTPAPDGP